MGLERDCLPLQRRAGGTLSGSPPPGPRRAALGSRRWLRPTAGCEQGWLGSLPRWRGQRGTAGLGRSPPVWGGAWEGAVGVGGWLGESSPVGWLGGSLASRPLQLHSLWRPGEPVQPFPFGVSARTKPSHPARSRCPHAGPGPAPASLLCLHSRAHLLTPITHICSNLPAHTLTHTHRSQAQCSEGKQAAQARGHTGLGRPHSHFRSLSGRGKPAMQMRTQAWGCRTAAGPSSIWSCALRPFRPASWAGAGAARLEVLGNAFV